MSFTAKTDHEKIINLVIKIRSLVSRLETLGASDALKYDGEFVSANYFQLPDRQKTEWLKFDKSVFSDKWSAMIVFLEEIYENAVQEKLLIASYMTTTPNKSGTGTFGATVIGDSAVENSTADHKVPKEDTQMQRLQETKAKVGRCPICSNEHTYKSKWSATPWPSDRLVQCKMFGLSSYYYALYDFREISRDSYYSRSNCPRLPQANNDKKAPSRHCMAM